MLKIIFIIFKKGRSSVGALQAFPVLFLPREIVFNNNVLCFLPFSGFGVFYGNVQKQFPVAVRNKCPVSVGLFLVIVLNFKHNFFGLRHGSHLLNGRKIGGMQQYCFHFKFNDFKNRKEIKNEIEIEIEIENVTLSLSKG